MKNILIFVFFLFLMGALFEGSIYHETYKSYLASKNNEEHQEYLQKLAIQTEDNLEKNRKDEELKTCLKNSENFLFSSASAIKNKNDFDAIMELKQDADNKCYKIHDL